MLNEDPRPPEQTLMKLHEAKAHFANLRANDKQTQDPDRELTNDLIIPILHSENARNPGLNAVECTHVDKMVGNLRDMLHMGGGDQEGHVRFHLGIMNDTHRIAVDAYRHSEGGCTLIALDSLMHPSTAGELAMLQRKNSDVIKGTWLISTPNQVHEEGCRIFGVHTLNALHDFHPYVQGLHQQLYNQGRGGYVKGNFHFPTP